MVDHLDPVGEHNSLDEGNEDGDGWMGLSAKESRWHHSTHSTCSENIVMEGTATGLANTMIFVIKRGEERKGTNHWEGRVGEQRLQPKEVLDLAVNEHSSTNSAE